MTQYAAFLDAGFLKGQGARRLGVSVRDLQIRPDACVQWAKAVARDRGGGLLRVYWYDGAFDPKDPRHSSQRQYFDVIRLCPGIQMRLGHLQEVTPGWQHQIKKAIETCGWDLAEFETHFQFRPKLEQKGVDTLIVLDIVRMAQRSIYDAATLVSGDRDIAQAVSVAQDEGKHLIVAHPGGGGVATELRFIADEVLVITDDDLRAMLEPKSTGTASP